MRWIRAFVIGNLLWLGLTFIAGVLMVSVGFQYREDWSNYYNFGLYPLGLWLGFSLTKTPFWGSKIDNKSRNK